MKNISLEFKILLIPPEANQGGQDFIRGPGPPGPTLATALLQNEQLRLSHLHKYDIPPVLQIAGATDGLYSQVGQLSSHVVAAHSESEKSEREKRE